MHSRRTPLYMPSDDWKKITKAEAHAIIVVALQELVFGARLGFSGKQMIHPDQVVPVQDAFAPDNEAITHARRVVEAFDVYQKEEEGAFALDGQMIDVTLVKNAQKALGRAKAAGKI